MKEGRQLQMAQLVLDDWPSVAFLSTSGEFLPKSMKHFQASFTENPTNLSLIQGMKYCNYRVIIHLFVFDHKL